MSYGAAALLAIAAFQSSQSPVVWKWEPDATCGLRQQLAGRRSILILREPINDPTTVTIEDLDAALSSWQALDEVDVTLEPGVKTAADGSIGPGDHRRSRSINVQFSDPNFLDQLSRSSSLGLAHKKFGAVEVPIRSAAAAVRALRACEERTMREWGIDAVQLASLQSRPIPISSPAAWFSDSDYPGLAAIFGVGGTVIAKLDVGTDGRVNACKVVNRQALTEFHETACRALTKRGRFKPAIDATGKPASAPFVVRLRFQMAQ